MGLDFVTMCAPTFQRSWDRNLRELSTPTLFTSHPELKAQTYRAVADGEFRFQVGQDLLIELLGGNDLAVCVGMHSVATIKDPPASLLTAVADGNGFALGTVQSVLFERRAANISVS